MRVTPRKLSRKKENATRVADACRNDRNAIGGWWLGEVIGIQKIEMDEEMPLRDGTSVY